MQFLNKNTLLIQEHATNSAYIKAYTYEDNDPNLKLITTDFLVDLH